MVVMAKIQKNVIELYFLLIFFLISGGAELTSSRQKKNEFFCFALDFS